MSKILYSWNSFDEDVKIIAEYVKAWGRQPYFVGINRGSLPLSVKLSNIFNTPMSIIDIKKNIDNETGAEFLINSIPSRLATVIVLDDILESGDTLGAVDTLLKEYKNVIYMTIYDNTRAKKSDIDIKVSTLRVSNGETIVFPWEIL